MYASQSKLSKGIQNGIEILVDQAVFKLCIPANCPVFPGTVPVFEVLDSKKTGLSSFL